MKSIRTLSILLTLLSSNAFAATILNTGQPSTNPDLLSIYTERADYDYYFGSLYVYEDFHINQNTTIDTIQYYALGGSTSSYEKTYLQIFEKTYEQIFKDDPNSGSPISLTSSIANLSNYSNTAYYSLPNGEIVRPYKHSINDLGITLNAGHYSLGISIDDRSSSYLGTSSGNIALQIDGTINPVPLPPSLWLFSIGLITLFSIKKINSNK